MEYVAAIFPSVGVLLLFVIAIRAIFQADRRERLAQAAEDRRLAAAEKDAGRSGGRVDSVKPDGPAAQD